MNVSSDQQPAQIHVKALGPPVAVPVYNCRVIVSSADAAGNVRVRAAELAGLEILAASQREALQKLVPEFKRRLSDYAAKSEEIPWMKPGEAPQPGERELFIAVHL